MGAALSFEEFDPNDTLDEDERGVWQNAMSDIELGVRAYGCEGLVQESLAQLSRLYRDARDAIANPKGELGQRLLTVYREGGLYLIRDGSWASND